MCSSKLSPGQYGLSNVLVGGAASLVFTIVLVLLADQMIKAMGKNQALGDLIYDDKNYSSLTRFQFFSWTIVFLFSALWIYSLRIGGGIYAPAGGFPTNTLALMGINTVSAVASVGIAHGASVRSDKLPKKEKFVGMLYEGDSASLARVQFFFWTIASILLYVTVLVTMLVGPFLGNLTPIPLQSLNLPDIDASLVTLMGLSHTAYLGKKYYASKIPPTEKK